MLIDTLGNIVQINQLKNKCIIMYGASTRNQKAIEELGIKENVLFFIDSDEEKAGKVLGEYKVCSLTALQEYPDCIILSVLLLHFEEITKVLGDNGIKDQNCLFYFPEFFNMDEVFLSNRETLEKRRAYQYIHVFSNDKFVIPFYLMLEERFAIEEHLLIVAYRIKEDFAGILHFLMEKCKKYHNILILDDVHGIFSKDIYNCARLIPENLDCNRVFYSKTLKEVCFNANKIFLHSAIWGKETKKFVYYLSKHYASKITWICFGGDAYFARDSFEVREIISNIGGCSVTVATYDVVKKNYGICGNFDRNLYYVYISEFRNNQLSGHNSVHILLGHSAAEWVNHKDGLIMLQKYKNENIKIYCPLSYGSEKYCNTVVQMGKELYGDKFIPLFSYLEQEHYFKFLQTMDVAVFPLKRTGAESTFLLLKAAGVKIYADMSAMGYMRCEKFMIEDINKIQNETFGEFATYVQRSPCCIGEINDYIVNEWKLVFAD